MPRGDDHTRVQSNLLFQPLISLRLTEKQGLIVRPMVPIVNSIPYFDQSGQDQRSAGFGDTVLAFALPRSLLGGRLMVAAGPTFIFPTASKDLLSQDTWQLGPDAGAVLLGKQFIAYAFMQQWFKIGGDGRDTNQMSGTFNFTYLFANGWTIGTQPQLSVDWKARGGERGTFGMGPQVGKMCKCGGLPTLFQLQVQYYPIRPERRRSEVEYSAASDADDSGPHQESPVLTRSNRCSVGRRFPGRDVPAATSTPATVESTALKPRIDMLRATLPQPPIRLGERVDFNVGELEASVAQRLEGVGRPLEERGAKLLVCQNLSDDVLHGFLHVYTPESSPLLGASSVAVLPSFEALPSWSPQEQPGCRRATGEIGPKSLKSPVAAA